MDPTTATRRRARTDAGRVMAAAVTVLAVQRIPGWDRVPAPVAYLVTLLAATRVAAWTRR